MDTQNFLAAVGGQHIGFKPDRSGILGLDVTGKYQKVTNPSEYKDKLKTLYLTDPSLQTNILGPFGSQIDPKGGFDSVYGIGITNTTRFVNTFSRLLSIDLSENKRYSSFSRGLGSWCSITAR